MFEVKKYKIDELFVSIKRGNSKYTKTFCRENSGIYPVYSANNLEPLAYFNSYDYDGRYMTISINGIAGIVTIIDGKFSINADRVVCIPKENVDIDYIKYSIKNKLRTLTKGRKGAKGKNEFSKLTPDIIKSIEIIMPTTENGEFDLILQNNLANKYKKIEEIKEKLICQKKKIEKFFIKKIQAEEYKECKLEDIFEGKTGNSKLTKAFCNQHKGIYEVYTGTTKSSFAKINTYEYKDDLLSFTNDGEYAGTVQILKGKYNVGGHRTILLPKVCDINIEYVKYLLEDILKEKYKKGDVPSVRWRDIKESFIIMPINAEGKFDINKQTEISEKYKKIYSIKESLIQEIEELINVDIIVNS